MSFEQTLFSFPLKRKWYGWNCAHLYLPRHTQTCAHSHTPVHTQVILYMWCDGLEIPSCIVQDENVPTTGPGTTGSCYYEITQPVLGKDVSWSAFWNGFLEHKIKLDLQKTEGLKYLIEELY